uniref:Uncharacterized protein n=1 Tax=Arundo donax TaxID=35708 RepID=A0A0A8YQY7_ARUDO
MHTNNCEPPPPGAPPVLAATGGRVAVEQKDTRAAGGVYHFAIEN